MSTPAEIRDRVANWVQVIQDAKENKTKADDRVDRQSLDRAADLEALYQDMSWVDEMPPIKRRRLGRRIDPKSREQFAKWVKQTYGWGTKQSLARLHQAHELVPILSPAGDGMRPMGERSLRPLAKLRAQGYGDHQVEVWREAVEAAGGQAPTPSEVSRAVAAFLERHKPEVKNLASDPRTVTEIRAAHRAKLVAEFDAILADDNREAKATLNDLIRRYNEHQQILREEKSA